MPPTIVINYYINIQCRDVMRVKFRDKDNRQVNLTFKKDNEIADGNHVLAIPTFKNQLLLPNIIYGVLNFLVVKGNAGKVVLKQLPVNYMKKQAPKLKNIHYIAQYTIETHDQTDFVKMYILSKLNHW